MDSPEVEAHPPGGRVRRWWRRQGHQLAIYWSIARWSVRLGRQTGLIAAKDGPRLPRWGYWGLFLGAAALPTWSGESVPYFLAAIAILGTWLIATPQIIAAMEAVDFSAFIPAVVALFKEDLIPVARRFGVKADLSPRDTAQLGALGPVLAQQVTSAVFLPVVGQLTSGAGVSLLVAVVGIMVAPLLQHYHAAYWSPAALLYALVFPYLVAVTLLIVILVMARTMAAALGADLAIKEATAMVAAAAVDPNSEEPGAVPGSSNPSL